jgi:hypothetical protein
MARESEVEDLFSLSPQCSDFNWICAVFANTGASEVIRSANDVPLKTYYPIRFNGRGEPIPIFRNYLFIEYRKYITSQVCRSTNKFIKILCMRDDGGNTYPVLLRANSISQSVDMMLSGKYDDRIYKRRFYGKGSLVRVTDGTFIDKKVRLEADLHPNMQSNKKVTISLGNWKGTIEVYKLAL